MQKEKDHKENGCDIMRPFEKLIKGVSYRGKRHQCQPRLGNQGRHAGPVVNGCVPDLDHVAFLDMDNDEWERMDEGEDQHGPGDPSVVDDELLVRRPRYIADDVNFRTEEARYHWM